MGVFDKKINLNSQKKKESLVLLCKCSQFKKKYCMRLDRYGHSSVWKRMVAFPYESQMASENYESNNRSFKGKIEDSEKYNGCPFCGAKFINFCKCGNVFDSHNSGYLTCPWCNKTELYSPVESVNFKGQSF